MLSVIVVDDEAPARRYLRRLLAAHDDIHVVGEAATRDETLRLIRAHAPDALFLDVELTQGTGFDVLAHLERAPAVVFVTAHAGHAVRAFDVSAVDYLLKPVSAERLAETLVRLRQIHSTTTDTTPQPYLIAHNRQGIRRIHVDALSAIVAQRDYVKLCCADGSTELIHATLSGLLPRLPSPPFFQASRSIIVNLDHVIRVNNGGNRYIEFIDKAEPLELGVTAFDRLRRQFALGGLSTGWPKAERQDPSHG